jgi:hypothetical protein
VKTITPYSFTVEGETKAGRRVTAEVPADEALALRINQHVEILHARMGKTYRCRVAGRPTLLERKLHEVATCSVRLAKA